MRKVFILLCVLVFLNHSFSQEKLTYQKPPKEILELVDAPLVPSVYIDSKGENVVLLYRDPYITIKELSDKEMRLAGLRINPVTNIGSRTTYFNNLEVKKATAKETRKVSGLPADARMANFRYSPDQT